MQQPCDFCVGMICHRIKMRNLCKSTVILSTGSLEGYQVSFLFSFQVRHFGTIKESMPAHNNKIIMCRFELICEPPIWDRTVGSRVWT
jgi:hypothetical protein